MSSRLVRNSVVLVVLAVFGLALLWTYIVDNNTPAAYTYSQMLTDAKNGQNLFMPGRHDEVLTPLGRAYLGGLIAHAGPCTVFATPTVNGYRRYRPNRRRSA